MASHKKKSCPLPLAPLGVLALLCGIISTLLALMPLLPGRSIFSAAGGVFRTLIGAVHGKPLWTAPEPDVPWEAVEVGPPPTSMFPLHVWTPNASRLVRFPDGRGVKLKLASAGQPIAYTIEGLLDPAETAELRRAALHELSTQPSTAQHAIHPRIAALPPSVSSIVDVLNHRTATLLRLPEALFHRSNLTTTWYAEGGQYLGHHDAQPLKKHEEECRKFGKHPTPGGPRFATVLWYLTNVPEGGETMFPHQGVTHKPSEQELDSSNPCSAIWGKLTIPAREGTGILWYNYLPDGNGSIGELDWGAFHRGCSVVQGKKFIATRWVPLPLPAECRAVEQRPAMAAA